MDKTKSKGTKSVVSAVSTKKGQNDTSKFPVSQVDYTQPVIMKNSKVTFGEKLEQVKEQHKDKLEDLIMEMDSVRKENDRLRRQQEDTYGITPDTVERMKHELERARTTRMFLLEDIEVRKAKSEKMETEIFELNMKLESYTRKINQFNREKNEWTETSYRLTKTEEKYEKLSKINKNYRMLLLKHHIDPKSVDFDSGKSRRSTKSEQSTLRPILKQVPKKKIDAHTQSHMQSALANTKSKSRSLDEIKAPEVNNLTKAMTSRKAMGRGPPSYLGYYSTIHHNRLVGKPRTEYQYTHLPKLVVV